MILKDVESLEFYGYKNPYSYNAYRERNKAEVYDEGVSSVLSRLDKIPVSFEWISVKDKMPTKEDWYLCVTGHKILPLYYVEEPDGSCWKQHFGRYGAQVIYFLSDDIEYWADFNTLPTPKE